MPHPFLNEDQDQFFPGATTYGQNTMSGGPPGGPFFGNNSIPNPTPPTEMQIMEARGRQLDTEIQANKEMKKNWSPGIQSAEDQEKLDELKRSWDPQWLQKMRQELPSVTPTKPGMQHFVENIPKKFMANLKDPNMLAFAAGLMDQSWTGGMKKWNFAGQLGHALGAMSKSMSFNNRSYKPMRFFEQKMPGRKGQMMVYDPGSGQVQPFGSAYELDKETSLHSKPKQGDYTKESWAMYTDSRHPNYGDTNVLVERPYDYEHERKKYGSRAQGGIDAKNANFPTIMKQWHTKNNAKFESDQDFYDYKQKAANAEWDRRYEKGRAPEKGDHFSFEEGENRFFHVFDGNKWNRTKSPKWNPQARTTARLYTMPDGKGQLTIGELMSLYKTENPKESSGLAGFAIAMGGTRQQKEAWAKQQSGQGGFGRFLDKIGFDTSQLGYLPSRTPEEYVPGMELKEGQYYQGKQGTMQYRKGKLYKVTERE